MRTWAWIASSGGQVRRGGVARVRPAAGGDRQQGNPRAAPGGVAAVASRVAQLGATAILEQGLKWQALGLSMVDSQFIESRNFQLRDIARAFDVPPYKLAIEGETEGPAMVQMGQQYLNGPISGYCERWKAKAEQFYELDGDDTFLDWDYGHFLKADLLSRFTAYRQAVGGPWMKVNEARRAEGLSSVPDGDTVQQAVNMAPLGWVPSARGGVGDQGSNQTGVPGEGGNGDPNRNPADDPAPGV